METIISLLFWAAYGTMVLGLVTNLTLKFRKEVLGR